MTFSGRYTSSRRCRICVGDASDIRTVRPSANASVRSQSRSSWVGGRDVENGVRNRQREHPVLPDELLRDEFTGLLRDGVDVRHLHPEPLRQRGQDDVVRHEPLTGSGFPVTVLTRRLELREVLGSHQTLERRQHPFVTCRPSRSPHFLLPGGSRQRALICSFRNLTYVLLGASKRLQRYKIRQNSRDRSTPNVQRPSRSPRATSKRRRLNNVRTPRPAAGYQPVAPPGRVSPPIQIPCR